MKRILNMAFVVILCAGLLIGGYIAGKYHVIYDAAIWNDDAGYSYLEIDGQVNIYSAKEE